MMRKDNQNLIIGILGTLVLVVAILVILTMNGTISFAKSESNTNSKEEIVENNNENILDEAKNDSIDKKENETKDNKTIEKYLGEWVLGFDNKDAQYTNINIKNSISSRTGYTVDIFINKEADYKNLDLYCADNSGVCYATGDENHHFGIVMVNEMVIVIPDYSVQGTTWECGTKR